MPDRKQKKGERIRSRSASEGDVTMEQKKRLAVIGNGFLAGIIVEAFQKGLLEEYELTGILGRGSDRTKALAEQAGAAAWSGIEELLEAKPDYVAEAASVQAVREYACPVLESGASLIVLSIGAFADGAFYEQVQESARRGGSRIHIASGAIGGFDVLRTVALMGMAQELPFREVGIHTRKGPSSLKNTPLFQERLMEAQEESRVFEGNAAEAIALLPTKVNVAVAASLATAGPEKTGVKIDSVPGMKGDDHRITARIKGVDAVIDIYSETSAIAGWSVVSVLRNLVSVVVF